MWPMYLWFDGVLFFCAFSTLDKVLFPFVAELHLLKFLFCHVLLNFLHWSCKIMRPAEFTDRFELLMSDSLYDFTGPCFLFGRGWALCAYQRP